MAKERIHSLSAYLLLALVIFQGLSGLAGGTALVAYPSGQLLQIPVSWLSGSPFSNYFYPGLILSVVLGLLPLIVAYGLWHRTPWCWMGTVLVGIALLIWIVVEVIIIGFHLEPPLQVIYGLIGLLIILFTQLPSIDKVYK